MREKTLLDEASESEDDDERSPSVVHVKDVLSKSATSSNPRDAVGEEYHPQLTEINTKPLHRLVLQSERWRNYSFNIGYELSQFKKMLTMCDDATIKVRRLVHNFEERMKDTQEQVWDENYQLRPDFDFKDITVAGLRDVILLHDWWAANAPGKTPEEMGMTNEEFMAFRRRCNKVSYNLRKNQYAQLLAVRIDRTRNRISELDDIIKDKNTLHWDDKYGADAIQDEGAAKWGVEEANIKARSRIKLLAQATDVIDDEDERGIDFSPKGNEHTKRISSFVDSNADEESDSDAMSLPPKDSSGKKISEFVDVELVDDGSDRMVR